MGAGTSKHKVTIERTYPAPIENIWNMWATKEGIESWWGPEGFATQVTQLDLRPNGELCYSMTAGGALQVECMRSAGISLTTEGHLTYTEVVAKKRIAYTHIVDFIPDVERYDITTLVEFYPAGEDVRMVLTFDSMHDEEWTRRVIIGHESQLHKLEQIIQFVAQ